jgi:hypothetical protein
VFTKQPMAYRCTLEDLLIFNHTDLRSYIRTVRFEAVSWCRAHRPVLHQLKALWNTIQWIVTYLRFRFGRHHSFPDYTGAAARGVYHPLLPLNAAMRNGLASRLASVSRSTPACMRIKL